MAISAATKTSDFLSGFLPPTMAAPIFEKAQRSSIVQQLVQQIPVSINSTTIPYVSGRPSAGWVGEGAAKPASAGSLGLKTITPKKLAAIMVVSAEVVRANPGNYMTLMRDELAKTFAISFDRAALHDEGPDGAAGAGPFDTYIDQTTKTVELGTTAAASGATYTDLVLALGKIVGGKNALGEAYEFTGWALDSTVEPALLTSVDTTGRPLFVDTPYADTTSAARPGRLIGRTSFMGSGVSTANATSVVGYGGDWSQAAWGVTGGISWDVSTQATVTINGTLTSLWENNLVAVRAEAEYGFLMNDAGAFVKLTNTNNSPVTSI